MIRKERWGILVFGATMIFCLGISSGMCFAQSFGECENECNWKKEICYQDCGSKRDLCMANVDALRWQLDNPYLTEEERSALEKKIEDESIKCINKQVECESGCFDKYFDCVDLCFYNGGGYGDPTDPRDPLNPKDPCKRDNYPTHWCPPECAMCE